jgi:hypothetical protein
MKTAVLVGMILLLACSTLAQWRLWGIYKGHRTYYQQLTHERSLVEVWVKKDHVLGHLAFDCAQHKVKYLSLIENENLLDAVPGWNTPGARYGEWLYNKACP